jgi:hypothetical protein
MVPGPGSLVLRLVRDAQVTSFSRAVGSTSRLVRCAVLFSKGRASEEVASPPSTLLLVLGTGVYKL